MEVIIGKCSSVHHSSCHKQISVFHQDPQYKQAGQRDPATAGRDYFYFYNYAHRKAFRDSAANQKFQIKQKLGNGAFGLIFEGKCGHR